MKKLINLIFIFNSMAIIQAQQIVSIDELVEIAVENNFQNTINDSQIKKSELDRKGAVIVPKTGLFIVNEDFSKAEPNGVWKIGLEQEIPWPGLNRSRKNYMNQLIKVHQANREAIKAEIVRDVKKSYYELWYLQQKQVLFLQLDSIYKSEFSAATVRFNTGDVAGLDKISAEVKLKENQSRLLQIDKEIEIEQMQLMLLTNQQTKYLAGIGSLQRLETYSNLSSAIHPSLLSSQQEIEVSKSLIEVEKQQNHPDFSVSAFSQKYLGLKDPISGFSVGVAFPLFGLRPMRSRVESLKQQVNVKEAELNWQQMNLNTQQEKTLGRLEKEKVMLDFYEDSGLKQADAIIAAASLSYKSGETSFAEMSQFVIQAIQIKQNYLESLNAYNQSVIEYNYLTNQN